MPLVNRNNKRFGRKKRRKPNRPGPVAARPPGGAKPGEAGPGTNGAKAVLPRLEGAGRILAGLLVGLVLIYLLALVYLRPPSPGKELRLDSLTRFAACSIPAAPEDTARASYCRGVDRAVLEARLLDEDARIVGTLVNRRTGGEERFWTSYPKSDAATDNLLNNLNGSGAEVSIDSQTPKGLVRFVAQFLLPLVILADLFVLLFMLIQGGAATEQAPSQFLTFGRVGERRQKKGKDMPTTTFADVAGAPEAIVELAEVRDYLANPSSFAKMGALPPKGVLLAGPPGCGKTLLAKAVAGEVKASFYSMTGSEFVEALVGIGAARVRDLFAQARANAPALIFIDELDSVGRQRGAGVGQGHDEREQTLNELLAQIDGFSSGEGIVVIGATNRPDILDGALLRAGRFDRQITVERPDLDGRLQILRLHARNRRLAEPEALEQVAQDTPGFTGADLANVLNEAALLAVREKATAIARSHLDEAVERVVSGPKRKGHIMTDRERRIVAFHEAGHAVMAAHLGRTAAIRKLSIIARGRGIGHLALLAEESLVVGRGDMEAQIAIAMAGFAAEELVFGEPSSGSESDLERATAAARDMAGRYGMSARLGPVRVLAPQREVFLGRDYLSTQDVSQPTLEHLDTEVRRILDEQKHNATDVLTTHRDTLENLAKALFEDETVQGEQLQRILTLPDKPIRKRVTTRSTNPRAAAGAGAAPSRNSR